MHPIELIGYFCFSYFPFSGFRLLPGLAILKHFEHSGIVTGVHRTRNDCDELAGKDDWIA